MKIIKKVIKIFIIVFLAVWIISLGKCEFLTLMHSNEFVDIYKENTMIGDIKYFRILKYSSDYARVYYVGKDYDGGNTVTFIKQNGKWKFNEWETVWSGTGGSASGVVWPYWWHFIYGGI